MNKVTKRTPKPPQKSTKIVPHHSNFNPSKSVLNEENNDGPVLFPYDINEQENPYDSETHFHVNYLKDQFEDIARPNLFKVFIAPPDPLMADWSQANNNLMVLAKSTKIPSMTVKEYVYQRAGQKIHIPTGEVEHGEASITFYNDSNFTLRSMFNRWMRLGLHNWEYNMGSVPLLALSGQVTIYHYDYNLDPVYKVKLMNAWPKSISEIELSQDTENTAEEFTVEFNYSYQELYRVVEDAA